MLFVPLAEPVAAAPMRVDGPAGQGLIWYAPGTPDDAGAVHPEYHWAGLQLLVGNLYLLAGLAALAAVATAAALRRSADGGRLTAG